jgi:hypothetical protein
MSTVVLEWTEPGIPAYHVETKCGRYSVSRVTVSARRVVHYIAWRLKPKRTEIDSVAIPLEHTAEQRVAAREAMKQRCAEDAAGVAA